MDKIFTAKDRAQEMGFISFHALLESMVQHPISMEFTEEKPVYAFVEKSRWIAKCDDGICRGNSYVDPEEDGFYCGSCNNANFGGKLRHVIFPDNYKEIEVELLKREVKIPPGMFGTQGARLAEGLPRSWDVGETIQDLINQREGYGKVTKDALLNEYSLALNRIKELEALIASKEGANGV